MKRRIPLPRKRKRSRQVRRTINSNSIMVHHPTENSKPRRTRWEIGIRITRIRAGTSGRLKRPHGETTHVSDGLRGTNSFNCSTKVQPKPSRLGLTGIKKGRNTILTGQGRTKKGQTIGATVIKEISPIGAIKTRVTKGIIMCHHIRGMPLGTIRISSITTKEIKGQEISSATIREVKRTIAKTRGVDQIITNGQVLIIPIIGLRGI